MRRRLFAVLASCLCIAVLLPTASSATSKVTTRPQGRPTTRAARAPSAPKPTTRTTLPSAPTANLPTSPTSVATGVITVFAAQSLAAAFSDLATAFEQANPGVRVTTNFAGSSTLVTQILNGAPADVFAAADVNNMEKLVAAKRVRDKPVIFTKNKLMIVVPKGNPLRVAGLVDLALPEVFVALGAPGVPVGDYARQVLDRARIKVTPKTLESNVAAIVNKAALREIDAGIVYVTDVAIDDYRVDGVAIPDAQNVEATYPIAAVTESRNAAAGSAFIAFVQTPSAQAILKKYKFSPLP